MSEELEPRTGIDLDTTDVIGIRVAVDAMIGNLRKQRTSREIALAITKLQEAKFWLIEHSANE